MMALRDELREPGIQPMLPQPGSGPSVRPDHMDPMDMEQLFRPAPEQPAPPPRQEIRVADASGAIPTVPVDEQPGGQFNVPSRAQSNPAHLLVADLLMGGTLAWAQAAADVATGQIPPEQFDEARKQHQTQLQAMRDEHKDLVAAAEKAMPFVSGLGVGMMKPAATVAGTAARGAGVAAAEGYVRGYTGGPVDEPTVSSTRMAQGIGGAALEAPLGAAGAAIPGGVKAGKDALDQRTVLKAQRNAEEAAIAKKRASTEKGQATRQAKKDATAKTKADALAKRAETERAAARESELADSFEQHRAEVKNPFPTWKDNRATFDADPVHGFNQAAERGLTLEEMSRAVNLPPSAILEKLRGKSIDMSSGNAKRLSRDLQAVDQSFQAFQKRGAKNAPKSVPDPGGAGSSAAAGSEPAAKLPTEPGGEPPPKPKRKSTPKKPAGDGEPKPKRKPAAKRKSPGFPTIK